MSKVTCLVFLMLVAVCLAGVAQEVAGARGAVAESSQIPKSANDGGLDLEPAASAYYKKGYKGFKGKGYHKGH